jgi:N-acetylglucosamine transport system permease protein
MSLLTSGAQERTAAKTPARPRRSRHRTLKGSTYRFVALCLAPALVLYLVFMVYPTVNVFRMALYKWSGMSATRSFVGLNNFRILAEDTQFIRAFQNTVLLLVLVTITTMSLALLLAGLLSRAPIRGQGIYRFILYIPNVLSIVIIAAMFSAIYDQRMGLINGTLRAIHLDSWQLVWLGNRQLVIFSVAIAMVWQSVGYYMVMYMAGMSNIPASLYEASALEGAGGMRQFFSITLPLIWTNVRTTLTFFIMSSVNLSFVLVTAMTGGGPDGASEVLLSYMYKQAYTNSTYGYGMAIGVAIFTFSFVLSLVVSRATRREEVHF